MQKYHWDQQAGPLSKESMSEFLSGLGYSTSCYVYSPGTYFPPHTHEVDKIDAVITGCLRISVDGEQFDLIPGDYIHLPKGVLHSAEVIGEEQVVSIDAVLRV